MVSKYLHSSISCVEANMSVTKTIKNKMCPSLSCEKNRSNLYDCLIFSISLCFLDPFLILLNSLFQDSSCTEAAQAYVFMGGCAASF